MFLSKLFGTTYRDDPAEAQTPSHKLLLKAGFIRPLAAGVYSYLPPAVRVMHKIMTIIREEMDAIDGQEILMPVLNPAELWMETGRYQEIGEELVRFTDRAGRRMVLAMTHEEVVTDLVRREVSGHRKLPFMVYQIQVKVRDEPRCRGGLLRVREFHMKDAYSFHPDYADLDRYYPRVYQAYDRIFRRCGIVPLAVEADTGMMGGSGSHEFMCLVESGEDTVVRCDCCAYASNSERAACGVPAFEKTLELLAVEVVATPGKETIADVAQFLGVTESQTIKAVFYNADGELIFVAIRGDIEVNETKLRNHLRVHNLEMADAGLLERNGMVAGYASPLGLLASIRVVADRSLEWGGNFVAGANKPGYHLRNVNPHRDLRVTASIDIGTVRDGDACPACETGRLHLVKGIELGHIFKLGTKYTDKLNVDYLDEAGVRKRIVMGCYGIGVGRLLSAVIEVNHDEYGMRWPMSLAPYHVHLISLAAGDASVREKADALDRAMRAEGIEVLHDERDETPGVKFNDADLIGCPIRLTVSQRSIKKGGAELKMRAQKEFRVVEMDRVIYEIRKLVFSDPAI